MDSAGLHWNGTFGSGNACASRDDVAIQKLAGLLLVGTHCHHKQGGNTFARIATWQHEGLPGMPKCSPPTCSTARHTDRYQCRQPGAVMHPLTVSTGSNAQQISSVARGKSLTAFAKERARFMGRREANRTSLAPSRSTWLVPHANRTRGQQDKSGATNRQVSSKRDHRTSLAPRRRPKYTGVVSTSGQQGKPGTTE